MPAGREGTAVFMAEAQVMLIGRPGGSVDAVLRKLLRPAVAEWPGAVHLTGSAETFAAPAPDVCVMPSPLDGAAGGVRVHLVPGAPDPAALLRHARRPVVLAGAGAVRCDASGALVRLAEEVGAPVVVSPMAKGVFPEDHPLFAGVLDMACNQSLGTSWQAVTSSSSRGSP